MFGAILLSVLSLFNIHNANLSVTKSEILSPVLSMTPTPSPTPTNTPTPTPLPTATPTPIPPTNTPVPLPPSNYEALFNQYSSQYGVDKNLLKKIATCESGINPGSVNGIYGGMFQFAETTWIQTRITMGANPDANLRFSAPDAIETAAYKISRGGVNAWAGCL